MATKMGPAFNFVQPVEVKDWVSGVTLATVAPDVGLSMMLRSNRFDHNHATADVRQLHGDDAMRLNIVSVQPITFNQLT